MREAQDRFWKRHPRLEASLITTLGLVVLVGGLGGYLADRGLSARGMTTTATVVDVHPGRAPAYDVRFTTEDGEVWTARTSYAIDGAGVGDSMQVDYDPEDPRTVAQVGARSTAWILWGGWLLVGTTMTLGSWKWWSGPRRRGHPPS